MARAERTVLSSCTRSAAYLLRWRVSCQAARVEMWTVGRDRHSSEESKILLNASRNWCAGTEELLVSEQLGGMPRHKLHDAEQQASASHSAFQHKTSATDHPPVICSWSAAPACLITASTA